MSPAAYKREREARGTQASVAKRLGVSRETIARRETGTQPIKGEAELALFFLPKTKRVRRPSNIRRSDTP